MEGMSNRGGPTQVLGTECSVPKYRGRHRAPRGRLLLAWTRRNPMITTMAAILALWAPYGALDAGGYLWALESRSAVSGALRPPSCPVEGGGSTLPCSWECATMGNRACGPDTPPLLIFRRDAAGEAIVCGPVGTGEICAPVASESRIEYIGSNGTIYRLVG